MVFSFFKKPAKKPAERPMPERPAVKPRPAAAAPAPSKSPVPPAPQVPPAKPAVSPSPPPKPVKKSLPDLEFPGAAAPAAAKAKTPPPAPSPAPAPVAPPPAGIDDGFDDFTDSSAMGIDVDQDVDPVQADVEQIVVLFANNQEAAARSLLEHYVEQYEGAEGKRFWLLLLDLLQITGDRVNFELRSVEYAQVCETSPPSWREASSAPVKKGAPGSVRSVALQGVLTGSDHPAVNELRENVAAGHPMIADFGRLAGCDDEIAGALAALLQQARHAGVPLAAVGSEGFITRLNARLPAGNAQNEPAWMLLLELLQRQGSQAAFEERAVDYAVTFERSPPSWETGAVATPPEPLAEPAAVDTTIYLSGDLKSNRFDDLPELLAAEEKPVIDLTGVRRMDFYSAGQLVNRIAPFKVEGKEIVIRCPHQLIAELMAVVGLTKQARIVVPKT